jgi:hypothetical protein
MNGKMTVLLLMVTIYVPTFSIRAAQAQQAMNGTSRSYLPLVESHLRNLTTSGLDVYGPRETGNWMAIIDTRTGTYPDFEHTPKRVYRKIGAPRGSSLYWDQPMIVAARQLSDITGKREYAAAADRYIRDFLADGIDENGLFLWGNHCYYDAFEDRFVKFSGGYHELRPHAAAWDLFWQHDPAVVERYIRTMAARHVYDPAAGGFNRHDNNQREHAFLEAGGVLVESLAWLYGKTKDRRLLEMALKIARYSFDRRGETTGLLVNDPDTNRWDSKVCTTEVAVWANSCLRAAEFSGREDFAEMAGAAVAAYLKYGYDADAGKYFGQLNVKDGKPVTASEIGYWPRKYSDIWNPDQWPTHDYPMAMAEACLTLHGKTGDPVFFQGAHRWAEIVCRSEPSDRPAAYAEQYGLCIRFLTRAGVALKQERYTAKAHELADEAVARLCESGWFQGYPESHLYEAVDGVGYLLLALMELEADALAQ